jgi:hydroxyacylglutathione hydrolase
MTVEGVLSVLRILPIDTPTLGDRSYLVHDGQVAFVVDPQRDIDRVMGLAASEGVAITHVFETHIHNDYVTGGYALAEATRAAYHVNADDPVIFDRVPIRDGEVIAVGDNLPVRVLGTPGHTFTHVSYGGARRVRRAHRLSPAVQRPGRLRLAGPALRQ